MKTLTIEAWSGWEKHSLVVLYFSFPLPGSDREEGMGDGMAIFHGKTAVPTQPCYSPLLSVNSMDVAESLYRVSLIQCKLIWQTQFWTNSFRKSSAATTGAYSTAPCCWDPLAPCQSFGGRILWRQASLVISYSVHMTHRRLALPDSRKPGCPNGTLFSVPCLPVSPSPTSNDIKHSAALVAFQSSEEKWEDRDSLIHPAVSQSSLISPSLLLSLTGVLVVGRCLLVAPVGGQPWCCWCFGHRVWPQSRSCCPPKSHLCTSTILIDPNNFNIQLLPYSKTLGGEIFIILSQPWEFHFSKELGSGKDLFTLALKTGIM